MEEGRKYPFEITITPEEVERGRHWITARLTNIATETITDVSATLYTYNSYNVDVLQSGSFHFIRAIQPQETTVMNFHIFANHSGRVYLHVTGYRGDNLLRLVLARPRDQDSGRPSGNPDVFCKPPILGL